MKYLKVTLPDGHDRQFTNAYWSLSPFGVLSITVDDICHVWAAHTWDHLMSWEDDENADSSSD